MHHRLPNYRPAPGGIDCPYTAGGPCWGQTTIVETADSESQHVDYYACEGHADVARYGFPENYKEPK